MTRIIILLLGGFTFNILAQCQIPASELIATYDINTVSDHHQPHHKTLTLLRSDNNVAYIYPNKAISEYWHQQTNGLISLTRYFEQYQQGIEYQASEVKNKQTWQQLNQIISPALLNKMTLTNTTGTGCQQEHAYTYQAKQQQISLKWLPHLLLVKALTITSRSTVETWQLAQLDSSPVLITQQFKQWQDYRTTDYADVSDNESDPFLAKMINMGFVGHASGFYQADGSAIDHNHNHHH